MLVETASLRLGSPAFDKTISERTLSVSLVFVIDLAADFMSLLMCIFYSQNIWSVFINCQSE